jgi:purine-binding chemotaxis protein CheW
MSETTTQAPVDGVQQETIDFKMVTFSLGGKDYGIDIMRVKEIAKFSQFTYVPNTAHFVRGVYNLRGDIISVIDLRLFFNLPTEQRSEEKAENGLILRLETNMLGVIVDSIDKVVGISSTQVQPPHPIFGDINVKYISGVAEYDERLYIILDVDRIFRRDEEGDSAGSTAVPDRPVSLSDTAIDRAAKSTKRADGDEHVERDFIADGLRAFSNFHVSPINDDWFTRRVGEWVDERSGAGREYQLQTAADAEAFLSTFHSRYTGAFWGNDYRVPFERNLRAAEGSVYNVWNPGCGSGHESYTIASALQTSFPEQQIKIWAADKDLLKISTAPNLVFGRQEIPEEWSELVVEGKNGLSFRSELKDSVLFEFSDVMSAAAMPKMDLIVARDLLSFHTPDDQQRILERFDEVLKPGGLLVLGDNERVISPDEWEAVSGVPLRIFIHR